MNIPEAKDNEPLVILKDLEWGVCKVVLSPRGTVDPKRAVRQIQFMRAPSHQEDYFTPAEGIAFENAQPVFDALAELVDEIRSVLVDDAITKQ